MMDRDGVLPMVTNTTVWETCLRALEDPESTKCGHLINAYAESDRWCPPYAVRGLHFPDRVDKLVMCRKCYDKMDIKRMCAVVTCRLCGMKVTQSSSASAPGQVGEEEEEEEGSVCVFCLHRRSAQAQRAYEERWEEEAALLQRLRREAAAEEVARKGKGVVVEEDEDEDEDEDEAAAGGALWLEGTASAGNGGSGGGRAGGGPAAPLDFSFRDRVFAEKSAGEAEERARTAVVGSGMRRVSGGAMLAAVEEAAGSSAASSPTKEHGELNRRQEHHEEEGGEAGEGATRRRGSKIRTPGPHSGAVGRCAPWAAEDVPPHGRHRMGLLRTGMPVYSLEDHAMHRWAEERHWVVQGEFGEDGDDVRNPDVGAPRALLPPAEGRGDEAGVPFGRLESSGLERLMPQDVGLAWEEREERAASENRALGNRGAGYGMR